MVRADDVIRDVHYIMPVYRKAEAARIIAMPSTTFRNWSVGYAYKRQDGSEVVSQPIRHPPPSRSRPVTLPKELLVHDWARDFSRLPGCTSCTAR